MVRETGWTWREARSLTLGRARVLFEQMKTTPPVAVTMREIRLALFGFLGINDEEARTPTDEELEAVAAMAGRAHGR